jgi:hypothetical protein
VSGLSSEIDRLANVVNSILATLGLYRRAVGVDELDRALLLSRDDLAACWFDVEAARRRKPAKLIPT